VDCPSGQEVLVREVLRTSSLAHVDLAIITHSHADHAQGIFELATRVPTRELRYNHDRVAPAGPSHAKWFAALRAFEGLEDEGVRLGSVVEGDSGEVGAIAWTALTPTYGQVSGAQGKSDPNYGSAIIRLEIGATRILVSGDADGRNWWRTIQRGMDVAADIFRLPHHGALLSESKTSLGIGAVLDAVGARYHVVSVGTLTKHPARATLRELQDRAHLARVMCTEVNSICLGRAPLPLAQASALPPEARRGLASRPARCRCAGTVTVRIGDQGLEISPDPASHGAVIDQLQTPMCRPRTESLTGGSVVKGRSEETQT
jgi:beta-lactamase superfamily II metal-dependent hydrolase